MRFFVVAQNVDRRACALAANLNRVWREVQPYLARGNKEFVVRYEWDDRRLVHRVGALKPVERTLSPRNGQTVWRIDEGGRQDLRRLNTPERAALRLATYMDCKTAVQTWAASFQRDVIEPSEALNAPRDAPWGLQLVSRTTTDRRLGRSVVHAPQGGVHIGNKFYAGGEFIPTRDLVQASDRDLNELSKRLEREGRLGPTAPSGRDAARAVRAIQVERKESADAGFPAREKLNDIDRRAAEIHSELERTNRLKTNLDAIPAEVARVEREIDRKLSPAEYAQLRDELMQQAHAGKAPRADLQKYPQTDHKGLVAETNRKALAERLFKKVDPYKLTPAQMQKLDEAKRVRRTDDGALIVYSDSLILVYRPVKTIMNVKRGDEPSVMPAEAVSHYALVATKAAIGREEDSNQPRTPLPRGSLKDEDAFEIAMMTYAVSNEAGLSTLKQEWATGNGPRDRLFVDGMELTEKLKDHEGVNEARYFVLSKLRDQLEKGVRDKIDPYWYSVRGGARAFQTMLNDIWPLVFNADVDGQGVVHYLGSYKVTMQVARLDPKTNRCVVHFQVYNESTLKSATAVPHLFQGINDPRTSGIGNRTTQTIEWTEELPIPSKRQFAEWEGERAMQDSLPGKSVLPSYRLPSLPRAPRGARPAGRRDENTNPGPR